MLNSLYNLEHQIEGRYASDSELQFINQYLQSFTQRRAAYLKLQQAELQIVQKVQALVRQLAPTTETYNDPATQSKCERDTLFVLRFSALALLFNDASFLEERVLLWLQTVMRSFKNHQHHCDLTYRVMQEVVKDYLAPEEVELLRPILELDRKFLGMN